MAEKKISSKTAMLLLLGGVVAVAVVLELIDDSLVTDPQWSRFLKSHVELHQ
jgi:hypothetical protein